MYNGIGLQTARGSGTNGYVQRNLSLIRTIKDKVNYRSEEELRKLQAESIKSPNPDILAHAQKRALELKCAEMEDVMKEHGYTESEVTEKVAQFRAMLMEREQARNHQVGKGAQNDSMGKGCVRETHALAEAQQQKNARLKEAFGISEFFVEGSSLDPDRKAKEDVARKALEEGRKEEKPTGKNYKWVRTPSPEPRKKDKKKKKKRDRSQSRSSSPDPRKKRKSKKNKRSR